MQLRENCKYAIVVPTSMGVRICPMNGQPVQSSDTFFMQATSAESNVISVASYLGMKTKVLTTFVKDSPIADFIKRNLRSRGIDYEGAEVEQGGPWGYRHQFNIADSGFGLRAPRVWNDRAGEIGRTLCAADFDLDRIFVRDGVGILHLSGLIAAMSEETTAACLAIAKKAKENGSLISFDLNYRATFWKGRGEELRSAFRSIASLADILVGNEEDFQLCLGLEGPATGGEGLEGKMDGFVGMIRRAQAAYPQVSVFATTLRQVLNANEHLWGAILLADGQIYREMPRPIRVMDRIGGGDGFTGGLLYGISKGWDAQKCLEFGWSCGVLAASSLNDYAEPADEAQLFSIYAGNARVQR